MTVKILDISAWQPPSSLKYTRIAEQIDGVVLRAAYGTRPDIHFETHLRRFHNLGVPIGAYHYIVNYRSARAQFDVFKQQVNVIQTLDLGNGFGEVVQEVFEKGFWCDVELEPGAEPLTRQRVDQYMALAEAEFGEFGIYTSRHYWDQIMRTDAYKSRKLWVAHYGAATPYLPATGGWDRWWMWQYTSRGRLDGYSGNLDLNHFWGTREDYNEWIGSEVALPGPDPDEPMYQVEIVNCNFLNIRKDPFIPSNPKQNVVGQYRNGDVADVWAERHGWLQTDKGWISAAYTQRVAEPDPEPPVMGVDQKVEVMWAALRERGYV